MKLSKAIKASITTTFHRETEYGFVCVEFQHDGIRFKATTHCTNITYEEICQHKILESFGFSKKDINQLI